MSLSCGAEGLPVIPLRDPRNVRAANVDPVENDWQVVMSTMLLILPDSATSRSQSAVRETIREKRKTIEALRDPRNVYSAKVDLVEKARQVVISTMVLILPDSAISRPRLRLLSHSAVSTRFFRNKTRNSSFPHRVRALPNFPLSHCFSWCFGGPSVENSSSIY